MAVEIRMPQLGLTMTEGTVTEWLKREGDEVKAGDVVARIETDKLTSDVESPVDGVLLKICAREGETLPVQGLLAVAGSPAEAAAEGTAAPAGDRDAAAPEGGGRLVPKEPSGDASGSAVAETVAKNAAGESENRRGGRIVASPLARKTASLRGISLDRVRGTGPGGRIRQKDVLARGPEPSLGGSNRPAAGSGTPSVRSPLGGMRKTIGRRMKESLREAPQVTLVTEARADGMIAFRERLNSVDPEARIGYTDILVKLSAIALRDFPEMNSSIDGDDLVLHGRIDVGVAVAVPGGLLVPVIKDADRKGLKAIREAVKDLAAKAREGRLTAEEASGGTFSVSNLGAYDVDAFTPIVNLPECAVLGVGRIVRKPVVDDAGAVVPASVMPLSLSFDHRIADGALAAGFLKRIKEGVENPDRMYL